MDENEKKNRKSRDRFALAISILILLSLVAVFVLSRVNTIRTPEITLPDQTVSTGSAELPSDEVFNSSESLSGVTVGVSNVGRVIATLNRPAQYTAKMSSTIYSGEYSVTSEVTHFVSRGLSRSDFDDGMNPYSVIVTATHVYTFRPSVSDFVVSSSGGADGDDFSTIPSYEDLISMPESDIVEASLEGEYIYVKTRDKALGYDKFWTISLAYGLLTKYSVVKNNATVYSCETSSVELSVPDGIFNLPNGEKAD